MHTELPSKYPKRNFKTAFEWHVYHVYNDPDFKKDCSMLKKNIKALHTVNLIPIADKYYINTFHVREFINGLPEDSIIATSLDLSPLHSLEIFDEDGWQFINISLHPSVTQKSLLKLWPKIEAAKKQLGAKSRLKPPENHNLIYAIFKARTSHTFKEIYSMYIEGTLPSYTGSRGYRSEDSLERYYNKYKPRIRNKPFNPDI